MAFKIDITKPPIKPPKNQNPIFAQLWAQYIAEYLKMLKEAEIANLAKSQK